MGENAEVLFAERTKRITDAIALQVPDRVPVFLFLHQFPAHHVGMTLGEAWYNLERWVDAFEKTVLDYEPDLYMAPGDGVFTGGAVHEALDNRQIRWPGFDLPATGTFQFVDAEYMPAEDYDAFLDDPSDYVVRRYLPTVYGALAGLRSLPPLTTLSMGFIGIPAIGALASPAVAAALESLAKAAAEAARWNKAYATLQDRLSALGFPAWDAGVAVPPYDVIADFLRGVKGAMIDMYRCPDKLLAAQEKLLPMLVDHAVAACARSGNPRVFIGLHQGADGFMTLEQFETFYWPGFKSLVLALIAAGLTPCPFFEGCYDQRLVYLRELPKGKIMGLFDRTDLVRAKEVIGDTMCIAGGMPLYLLQIGTPQQVVEHTKKVIDSVGRDGGFIMSTSTMLDDARPELVKLWVDTTKEYSAYR